MLVCLQYDTNHHQNALTLAQILALAGQPADSDWRAIVTDQARINTVGAQAVCLVLVIMSSALDVGRYLFTLIYLRSIFNTR